MLWNELPKTKLFSLRRTKYGAYRGVVRFNHGSEVLEKAEGLQGLEGLQIRKRMDRKRESQSSTKAEKKEEEKNRKIRRVQEQELRKAAEGITYEAGKVPLA